MTSEDGEKRSRSYLLQRALKRLGQREYTPESLHKALMLGVTRSLHRLEFRENRPDAPERRQQSGHSHPLHGIKTLRLSQMVDSVVLQCVEQNWCSRERAISDVITSGRRQGRSRVQLRVRLHQEGIDPDEIDAAISNPGHEAQAARFCLNRYLRQQGYTILEGDILQKTAALYAMSHQDRTADNDDVFDRLRIKCLLMLKRRGFTIDTAEQTWQSLSMPSSD